MAGGHIASTEKNLVVICFVLFSFAVFCIKYPKVTIVS